MRTSFRHQSEAQPPNGPLTAAASPDTPSRMPSHAVRSPRASICTRDLSQQTGTRIACGAPPLLHPARRTLRGFLVFCLWPPQSHSWLEPLFAAKQQEGWRVVLFPFLVLGQRAAQSHLLVPANPTAGKPPNLHGLRHLSPLVGPPAAEPSLGANP
jgi:hypothetical protein